MNNFEFLSPTKIVFGKGTENRVGQEIKNVRLKKCCFTTVAEA